MPSANTVLITGASSGIGAASSLALAARGWRVYAGVRRDEDGRTLEAQGSGDVRPLSLDVTDTASVGAALQRIQEESAGQGLGALVNNAGIAIGGPVECVSLEDWRRQFEVNVFGALAVTQAALPLLRKVSGRIVNVSSISGRIAMPMLGPYAASKFALEAISDALRLELRAQGVHVVLIEPGAVETPIWEKSLSAVSECEAAYPAEARTLYGSQLNRLRAQGQEAAQRGMPVAAVVDAVVRALTAKRPRIRYLLGRHARMGWAVSRLLPDRWWDDLVASRMR